MIRKFWSLLIGMALAVAAVNMACGNTIKDPDKADETDGAT